MSIHNLYLDEETQEKIKKIPDERRWNNYRNFDLEVETWHNFWSNTYQRKDTKEKVLDFGCGAAYNEVVANKLNIANVVSLDIDTKEVKIVFGRFHKALGIKAKYWDGKKIDYQDNYFDAVTAKASLSKRVNSDWDSVVSELIRVTKDNGIWYISPPYMIENLAQNIKPDLVGLMKSKNISIVAWTWDLQDPRNRYWKNFKDKKSPKEILGNHDIDYKHRKDFK